MSQILTQPPGPSGPPSVSEAAALAGRKLRRAGMVAAVLVIVGALAGLLPRWAKQRELRAETQKLAVQTVAVVSPTPGKAAPALSLPAELKPLLEAPIYARANGYLKRWLVDIGARVKEGDLLAEIETPELDQELLQARAQQLQAEAALSLAQTTAARWTELVKTASVSEQEASEKQADLQLKKANLEAAQANVRRLENLQSFAKVRAPFDGTITARKTDVGDLIVAGSGKELFRLAQTGTLRVYVRVPQTAARAVAPDQTASITIPELPGRTFPAKVVRTAGALAADSRTLLVELSVGNEKGELLAGSFAQVTLKDALPAPVLGLPSNTLLFHAEGPQVGVVNAEGKVELRHVTLGRDLGPTVEILGGVGASDRVILNPPDSLVDGVSVRIAENSVGTPDAK